MNRLSTKMRLIPSFMLRTQRVFFSRSSSLLGDSGVFNTPDNITEPPIPEYKERTSENIETKRARILYQSRKRGMLENDLLLSSFASRYLPKMNDKQLQMYDHIINKPNNDWDIFNWITGKVQVPAEFDNEVMKLLKEHAKNADMEDRTRMPDLA